MIYSAPWGKLLIGVSIVASVILVGLGWISWRSMHDPRWLGVTLGALLTLVFVFCLLFMIRGYRVDGPHLYVSRLLWETDVDLRGLESIEADAYALQGAVKLFGNGGLFSFSGIFYSKRLGRFRAFATNHQNAVVVRVSGRTIVVSPGDPQAFVADILVRNPHLQDRGTWAKEER